MRKVLFTLSLAVVFVAAAAFGAAAADYNYYQGKQLTLIIPHNPGGGFDTYARTIAPYLEKEMGVKITPKQAKGGGGIRGTNLVWASKPDGLTYAISSIPSLVLSQLSGAEGVQYDATKFTILARTSTEPRVFCVGPKSDFKEIGDLAKAGRVIKFPSQGLDEDFFTAAVMAQALGFELQQITGYEGNADTALAVVRGEGDGHITALSTSESMIKDGDKTPLLMFWPERVAGYENVPTALEVTSGQSRDFMKILVNLIEIHRCFFAPPGIPEEAAQEFRAALDKVMNDPTVVKDLESKNRPVVFMNGADAQKRLDEVAALAEQIKPILVQAVKDVQ